LPAEGLMVGAKVGEIMFFRRRFAPGGMKSTTKHLGATAFFA